MINKINWKEYVDHIFCLNYLPNNRLNKISKTLENIGININDSNFFSFIYDYEHCIFKDQYQNMKEESFKFFNENKYFINSHLDLKDNDYGFYIGLNTYRALKIAQYFNYDRIIIFEDDIAFLKDTNYIINAMNFAKTQDFDICMCQTTFMEAYHGIKSYLLDYVEDLGNDMFVKFNRPIGTYGGGFIILTNKGINKIAKYFEDNNLMVALDVLDTLIDKMNLEILYALKPLCVQNMHFNISKEELYERNANINIEEYEQN